MGVVGPRGQIVMAECDDGKRRKKAQFRKRGIKSGRKMISISCKVFVGNISYRVSEANQVCMQLT